MMVTGRVKHTVFVLSFWILSVILNAQPAGYYSTAEGKTGASLQQALHDIIDNHIVLSYTSLPTHFQKTDRKSDGTVWDMYSDIPGKTPAYVFVFNQDECGNYSREGDCFNREHSFPKSWFNDLSPMNSDINHIVPTDGWVNNKRANYPFGTTNSPAWTSTNGSKFGPSSYPGYTGIIFEPVNSYKGDFARIYFYMAVRYFGEDTGWPGSDMVTGSQPKEWALKMLMEWDTGDPVSQKEKDRNDSVFILQGNRNPFIDNPLYATLIWGIQNRSNLIRSEREDLRIFPNPSNDLLNIDLARNTGREVLVTITDISGRALLRKYYYEIPLKIDLKGLRDGLYIVTVEADGKILRSRIIVSK